MLLLPHSYGTRPWGTFPAGARIERCFCLRVYQACTPWTRIKKSTFSGESLDFGGPVGQVFDGFGVFREFSGGPGRSGMVQGKSGRLLHILIFANFPKALTILSNFPNV